MSIPLKGVLINVLMTNYGNWKARRFSPDIIMKTCLEIWTHTLY